MKATTGEVPTFAEALRSLAFSLDTARMELLSLADEEDVEKTTQCERTRAVNDAPGNSGLNRHAMDSDIPGRALDGAARNPVSEGLFWGAL